MGRGAPGDRGAGGAAFDERGTDGRADVVDVDGSSASYPVARGDGAGKATGRGDPSRRSVRRQTRSVNRSLRAASEIARTPGCLSRRSTEMAK